MKTKFKNRLKAAVKSFLNPVVPPKIVIQKQVPEPLEVMENQLLNGKNVLIVGVGKNIGRSIALEMAKQGANIFFADIAQETCRSLEQELKPSGVIAKGFHLDVSKPKEIDSLVSWLGEHQTKIDILINNVGIQFETVGLKNLEPKEWNQTFNTNVFGPAYLTKLISEKMIKEQIQGSIIFMTSMYQWDVVRWPSYSSSKAALGMLIKELAVELAPKGIRVNGIAPGWVAEDQQGNPLYHEYTLLHQSSINPSYIGRGVVYLASDYFSMFTTGTVLKIDAGVSLYNSRVIQNPPQ